MILLPPPPFLFAFWDTEGAGSFIIHRYQYLCLLEILMVLICLWAFTSHIYCSGAWNRF